MRTAFVTSESGLGGGETSLLNLLSAGRSAGWNPVLVCPAGSLSEAAKAQGVEVREVRFPDVHLALGFLPLLSIRAVREMGRLIRDSGAGIIHAESFLGLVYGGLAARLLRIPCVATCHGYWKLKHPAARVLVSACCDRLYPVSRAVDREFAGWFSRRQVIALGFSEEFRAPLPEPSEARQRLGLPTDARIVLQVGRFQAIKGQMNLLRAAERMVASGWQRLLILFAGSIPDGPDAQGIEYQREIAAALRSKWLAGRVRLLGHRSDVPLLMRAADVVVCPSEFETFGMNVIEAMAAGTPVIATRVGALAEIIADDVTGRLAPAGDVQGLASRIAEVLSDSSRAKRLSTRARELALERYAPEVRVRRLSLEYEHVLASWGRYSEVKVQDLKSVGRHGVPAGEGECGMQNADCKAQIEGTQHSRSGVVVTSGAA